MNVYKINAPEQWNHILTGETIVFDVPGRTRAIKLRFNVSAFVDVFVSYNEDMTDRVLLASDHGLFECELVATKRIYVQPVSELGALIYVTGTAADHTVKSSDDESFTRVEPLGKRRGSELAHMMKVMNLNMQMREQQSMRAMQAMQRRLEQMETTQVVDDEPQQTNQEGSQDDGQNENLQEQTDTAAD